MSWIYGGGGASKNETSKTTLDGVDEEDVYTASLPPTVPVVKETIDSITSLAVKQRMFLVDHANSVKLELVKESSESLAEKTGSWALNGFPIEDHDAVDIVRTCPDLLSNLTYSDYQSSTTLWTRIASWLRFSDTNSKRLNVVEDLGYVLSIAETVEVAGHLLASVSYALTEDAPSSGRPLRRELAYELVSSKHRGNSHSMYLIADLLHESQRIGHARTANTLRVASSLYIYEPLVLGGVQGVGVNVSGDDTVRDVPTADVDSGELKNLLSSKGHFVASATSDFVLDPELAISSERAAKIACSSADKLVSNSNASLASFFENEATALEADRAERRRMAELIAAEERKERELRAERERRAEEELIAAQRSEYEKRAASQDDRYLQEYVEYVDEEYAQKSAGRATPR